MEEKAMTLNTVNEIAMVQGLSLEEAQQQFKKLQGFIKTQMVSRGPEGPDFGIIPGTKKPSLYKPGAEKLLYFHGLGVRLSSISGETIADWKNKFFNFSYRAEVYNPRSGNVIATADGSCNSKEGKYAYRWLTEAKVPKGTNINDLPSKEVQGSRGSFMLYRMDNDDICDIVNTLQKMAQKRAMVAAVLIACRASDIFTTEEEAEQGHGGTSAETPKDAKGNKKPAISAPQLKRLMAIAGSVKVSEEKLREHVREKYPYTCDEEGICHLSRVSWADKDYETLCSYLEAQKA